MPARNPLNRGGPQLPYDLLAGVEPCPAGWLVVSGKLQGITLAPQAPMVLERFVDLLDYRPPFNVVAIRLPLGLLTTRQRGGRDCDRNARALLHWPRSAAIASPPTWEALEAWRKTGSTEGMSAVTRNLLPRISEAYEHLGTYHQRGLFEVDPELSFFQLNGDRPLRYPKRTRLGMAERRDLLASKLQGVDRILDTDLPGVTLPHLLDAAAHLWTARRIAAHAVARVPEIPEWDDQGFRMEILR